MFIRTLAATIFVAAFSAQAQVEIIDSKPVGAKKNSANPRVSASPNSPQQGDPSLQNELYFQLQMMQQEVLELRGLVEELSYEIKRLKQQRLDDYLDLDRRLGQLGQQSTRPAAKPPTGEASSPKMVPTATAPPEQDELASYREAIDLVLKKRDFDGGASALQKYVQDFPNGHYTANAQYWLGQIYFQKGSMDQSEKWFSQMIQQFPQHHKTPEAKFKLAKILNDKGDTKRAKELLQQVVDSNTSVSSMAQEFLKSLN